MAKLLDCGGKRRASILECGDMSASSKARTCPRTPDAGATNERSNPREASGLRSVHRRFRPRDKATEQIKIFHRTKAIRKPPHSRRAGATNERPNRREASGLRREHRRFRPRDKLSNKSKSSTRTKAVLKPPHSRRWRDQRTPQPARSVWTAARLPPL